LGRDFVKFLCVEDNATQRHMIDLMLASTGIDIDFAASGAEGLDAFQTSEYDIILMDSELPDMTGTEAVRAIRQMESGFHLGVTPVLFLGRVEDEADLADGCLPKPFTADGLKTAINRILTATRGSGLEGTLRAAR
jgi:CheY-like chemotaxis protein